MIKKIEKWFLGFRKRHAINDSENLEGNYRTWISNLKLNNDLTINADRCNIAWTCEDELPKYIKFNHIYGDFICCFSRLEIIENNGPKIVDGNYIVYIDPKICDFTEQDIRKICDVKGNVIKNHRS
jgi:hypothetical protein